jgi:hypothetical protein
MPEADEYPLHGEDRKDDELEIEDDIAQNSSF